MAQSKRPSPRFLQGVYADVSSRASCCPSSLSFLLSLRPARMLGKQTTFKPSQKEMPADSSILKLKPKSAENWFPEDQRRRICHKPRTLFWCCCPCSTPLFWIRLVGAQAWAHGTLTAGGPHSLLWGWRRAGFALRMGFSWCRVGLLNI